MGGQQQCEYLESLISLSYSSAWKESLEIMISEIFNL